MRERGKKKDRIAIQRKNGAERASHLPLCLLSNSKRRPRVLEDMESEVHRSAGAPFLIAQKGGKDGVGIDCISFASPQSGKAHTFRHASFQTRSVCFEFGRTEGIGVRRSAGPPFCLRRKGGKTHLREGGSGKSRPPPLRIPPPKPESLYGPTIAQGASRPLRLPRIC